MKYVSTALHYCPGLIWAGKVIINKSFILAKVVSKTVSDSEMRQSHDCTCLGHLGQRNTDRIISIYVVPPKVAKESTEGTILL